MLRFLFAALIGFLIGFVAVYYLFSRSDYREGAIVLSHYLFGDGSDLYLHSDYIPKSPVILQELRKMKVGEKRKVSFKQNQDWRLSYAINGFELKKTSSGFSIHQYILFDTTGTVYTDVKTIFGKVRVYDHWVHYIGRNPYHLYYRSRE